ncbi:MAG: AIPR family protein [Anaerolineae bacterium]|nr:AIPR family protein [Anaerolineae bacterium]NUQ06610.1 AIPR family protein [Anaerolineae bacterium]
MDGQDSFNALDDFIEAQRQVVAPTLPPEDYFTLFAAEWITRDFALRLDDLQEGIIKHRSETAGVDALYLFVNDAIMRQDGWFSRGRGATRMKLLLLLAKPQPTFELRAIERAFLTIEHLFSPNRDLNAIRGVYSARAILLAQRFRQLMRQIGADKVRLHVQIVYACKGDAPPDILRRRVDQMQQSIQAVLPRATFDFEFVGAEALWQAFTEQPRGRLLKISGDVIRASNGRGFVCMVRIGDYYRFITRGGVLERRLFEANVRDYQGRKTANKAILQTLNNPGEEDFWWLNNGVTIIARRATLTDEGLQIVKPEIVNGLQTSFTLHEYCARRGGAPDDARTLLVRVIAPRDDSSHEQIIRATNSQTPIPPDAFRALDPIQRDIELFLLDYGIYYDRRDQYYFNERMPVEQIVSVRQLAQALMALFGRPETAYSRPGHILAEDASYRILFDPRMPFQVYFTAISLSLQIERMLASPLLRSNVEPAARGMMRYHVLWFAACRYLKRAALEAESIASLPPQMPEKFLLTQVSHVLRRFKQRGATNAAAKGAALVEQLRKDLHAAGAR